MVLEKVDIRAKASRKLRDKGKKVIARSCDAMCDKEVWTKGDHRLIVQVYDMLCDEIRDLNTIILRVAGMAHMDIAIDAAMYAEALKNERTELKQLRMQALKRGDHVLELKEELDELSGEL